VILVDCINEINTLTFCFSEQQPGCALHRAPAVNSSTFSAGGPLVHDVWNFEALPRRSLQVPSSTFTGDRPVITSLSLPLPHDYRCLPYRATTSLLPAVSDSRLASPKPWYSQVEFLTDDQYHSCTVVHAISALQVSCKISTYIN